MDGRTRVDEVVNVRLMVVGALKLKAGVRDNWVGIYYTHVNHHSFAEKPLEDV